MATGAELNYNTGASATQMANEIFGSGVTVVNATYSGSNYSSAIYGDGDALAPGVTPGDTGVILSTGRATSFTRNGGDPNRSGSTSTNTGGQNNNAEFNAIVGANTYDASYITVEFIPTGDTMTMQFVFSSEEYPEYINSIYNDAVILIINGQEVEVEIGTGTANVSNVNSANNFNLYNDNTGDAFNTEMDGFTVTMTATIPVNAGVLNEIIIGIVDVGDSSYDSNLLIAGDSIQTTVIAQSDYEEMYIGGTETIDVLGNDENSGSGTLTITHINGQAVTAGDSVTLATGQVVTLNADGTFTVTTDNDVEEVNFTYAVVNGDGITDTGYVTINTVPCFVTGTLIQTDRGQVLVEDLDPGDLVMTADDGLQPIRWVGRRRVAATGKMAPVRIAADTFGQHGEIWVSPQHRVLLCDDMAEILFGEREILVAAKDLVNDCSVRIIEGGEVEYVHLLFDRHQIVFSEGLATESFYPGPHILKGFEEEIVEEICTLFPELDPQTGQGYSPAARPMLKAYEAQVLMQMPRAA